MATKWRGQITCRWCGNAARAGIEKDGFGRAYRVVCQFCGVNTQVALASNSGANITKELEASAGDSTIPSPPTAGLDGTPVVGSFLDQSGEIWILTRGGVMHSLDTETANDLRKALEEAEITQAQQRLRRWFEEHRITSPEPA